MVCVCDVAAQVPGLAAAKEDPDAPLVMEKLAVAQPEAAAGEEESAEAEEEEAEARAMAESKDAAWASSEEAASLAALLLPAYQALVRGELHDPHHEFFVEMRPVPLHKLWHERYVLVEAMLPCFLSRALGEQVLLVGKAINFIRLSCADAQWSLLGTKGGAPDAAAPDAAAAEEG